MWYGCKPKGGILVLMIYWAIVHHDEGSAFGVSFPDVPDCFAASDDEGSVMLNAITALDDYFQDRSDHPVASALEDVRRRYAEDLAEGAYLIQVPFIPRKTKVVRVNVSFEQGLLEAIDEAAKRADLNRSSFLAHAALREITDRETA